MTFIAPFELHTYFNDVNNEGRGNNNVAFTR